MGRAATSDRCGCFIHRMDNNYTVYKHTSPSGKVYIGITSQSPEKRWRNGKGYEKNTYFYKAICKYGWDNIKHEIIAINLSKSDACALERELIEKHKAQNPEKGYNNSVGGEFGSYGAKLSDEARRNISEGHKGKKHSEETKQKLSVMRMGENNPNFGKHPSEETLEKQRKIQKEVHSRPEYKEKQRARMKQLWENEEFRKKISEANKGEKNYFYGKHLTGEAAGFYGKHHTNSSKEKLRESHSKPIICIETQIIYPSATVAEALFSVAHSSIHHVLNKPNKTSCGYHWEYYEEGD